MYYVRRAILLQTMGWDEQETNRPSVRWPDVGRNAMSDTLPTIWPAEPHTIVKHRILERYLQAWLPILSHQSHLLQQQHRQILFIDGFAGPGIYEGGQPGSPVIAVKTALDHSVEFPVPI